MITEDYCSEELSGMLMEKGYIGAANTYLGKDNLKVKRITIQSALKWLREVHYLHVWFGHSVDKGLPWYYEIHGISDGKVKHISGIQCGSYEVACEAAIKYCLENLI